MNHKQVTIVVVPRERFSYTKQSLESVYENTTSPFSLVYVDGGSPAKVKRYLEAESQRKGFHLVRTNRYLSPNQARNLGLQKVDSKYVVFLDNDVIVTPGWLDALVQCAEDTGAWAVGPLYLEGPLSSQVIHMAGGKVLIKEVDGKRMIQSKMRFFTKRVPDIQSQLIREPTDYVEFHCMLLRREAFERIGLLDEKLLSSREHIDVGLSVKKAGGSIYIEPASVVTYMVPTSVTLSDIPYLMLRWSEAWNRATIDHFQSKWDLHLHERQMGILRQHRHVVIAPLVHYAHRIFGQRGHKIERELIIPLERTLNHLLFRGVN